MRSLRVRLALSVIAVAVLLIAGLAAMLYWQVSRTIRAELDRQLVEDAQVLANLVEYEPGEGVELEIGPLVESFARERTRRTWWKVWARDGRVLAADPASDWIVDMPREATPTLHDATSDDGAHVRVVAWRFHPRVEQARADADAPMLALAVARDTRSVDALLGELAALFWLLGTATCVIVGGVAAWQVARGLRPVRRLSVQLERDGSHDAVAVLETSRLPIELIPFVRRINALVQRLQSALEREREFAGHVAHELRTPLTVLRTSLELAIRREPAGAVVVARMHEMLRTVEEMSTLVDNLLTLARVEGGHDPIARERVDLHALVGEVWRDLETTAVERGLQFHNRVPEGTTLVGDPAKLRIIVRNLLSNAASYTEPHGQVCVEANDDEVLGVWDSGPALPAVDLERLFDRFWRSDSARTDATVHAGIGLALTRALCHALGYRITATNAPRDGVRFTIRADSIRGGASPEPPARRPQGR